MIQESLMVGNMKRNFIYFQEESSKSGYTPKIQVTTGTYCVTSFSSQSSGKPYYSDSPKTKIVNKTGSKLIRHE